MPSLVDDAIIIRNSFLILACVLSSCPAFTLFDEELYRSALDPVMCARQLEAIEKSEFYESSFRVPEGLRSGNLANYGNFHQCLAIKQYFPGRNIEGKYCLIRAQLTAPIVRIPTLGGASDSSNLTWTELTLTTAKASQVALRLAVCVPKPCTVDALLQPYVKHPLVRFNYTREPCRLPSDIPFDGSDYVILVILSLIGFLTIVGTAYELHYIYKLNKESAEPNQLLRAWSLYTNIDRLLTFDESPQSLYCLDGIRALSVLWIIVLHSALLLVSNSTNQFDIIHSAIYRQKYLWTFTGHIAVDSFFVLSGLLLVYTTTNKNEPMNLRNLALFYLNRYMRLFPVLATMILLRSSVMHRLVDGPRQLHYIHKIEGCRAYWWSALLHLQNIINPQVMCLSHSWYLSVDTQLYVVSPLVLWWVLRRPRAAWCALAVAVLTSLVAALAFCFYFNFANMWLQSDTHPDGWPWYYINPLTRSPPFFIGMLFGYMLHVYRNQKLHLSKWNVFLCYSLALVTSSVAIFQEHPSIDSFWKNHQVAINIRYALYRTCWAIALCWLIIACAHGYGGPVNWFLSLKLWRFLARISYAMYLSSLMIQVTVEAVAIEYYFDIQSLLWKFAGDLAATVVLSMATCVVVEAPVATLYSMLIKRIQSRNN